MRLLDRRIIKVCFTTICFSVVVTMVSYWVYKYEFEDRDIAVVDYISFRKIDNTIMPVPTFCLRNPFIEKKLKQTNKILNITKNLVNRDNFLQHLEGNGFKSQYNDIDYKNVTIDMGKYFLFAKQKFRNESKSYNSSLSIQHVETFNGFYLGQFLKCFTIKFDTDGNWHIKALMFQYDFQKLLKDWKYYGSELKFYVKVHSIEQFLVGDDFSYGHMNDWSTEYNVFIKDFEILNKRSSRRRKCNEYSNSYDTMILHEFLVKEGCRPLYATQDKSFPLCNTMEKMKKSKFNYEEPEEMDIKAPCQRISKIRSTRRSGKKNHRKHDEWSLSISYPKEFKIITQSKEVDIHALIGNIGGYLGLFMGTVLVINN